MKASDSLASVPKADLHVHQEATRYLDLILAEREGREPYDWAAWRRRLAAELPPGKERLQRIGSVQPVPLERGDDDELFVARFAALMRDHAAAGAWYVEIRCGGEVVTRDGFMSLFRQAEQQVRADYPRLRAEALAIVIHAGQDPDRVDAFADGCIRAAGEGLAGIDFLYAPYDTEADWTPMYRLAERFAEAGLGITAHAGEVSTANIAAAARMPGLTRIGHGIHAAADPALLHLLVDRGVTLECALTCNDYFGVLPDLEQHPLPRLVEAGVAVTLATDNPVQLSTTIEQEYAMAAGLGMSVEQLADFTRNAIRAAFTSDERKSAMLGELAGGGADCSSPVS
ncbi:adenosine deaminase family protein [Streptomyces sp. 6N223]|uniref:adenosine deaminase family protein n=1 Tax=Streptomyces sp. 6N223 TaxID=3457412 RepID=UPI003FD0E9DA